MSKSEVVLIGPRAVRVRALIWTLRVLLLGAVVGISYKVFFFYFMYPAQVRGLWLVVVAGLLLGLRALESWRKMVDSR